MSYEEIIDELLMPPPPKRLKALTIATSSSPENVISKSSCSDDVNNSSETNIAYVSSDQKDFYETTGSSSIPEQRRKSSETNRTYENEDIIYANDLPKEMKTDEPPYHFEASIIEHRQQTILDKKENLAQTHKIQIQKQQQCCENRSHQNNSEAHQADESLEPCNEASSSKNRHHSDNDEHQHRSSEGVSNRRTKMVDTRFSDIIGHGHAKLRLDEALLPLALPQHLADSILTGVRAAPASILLHGPPGCGKTQLARAVAGEAQAAFISVGPSDVLSKFVGESEAAIRGLFREARMKAEQIESRCSVLFFDEVDALGQSRGGGTGAGGGTTSSGNEDNGSRRILAELLIQMTKMSSSSDDDSSGGESEEEDDEDGVASVNDQSNFAPQATVAEQFENNNIVSPTSDSDEAMPAASSKESRARPPKPRIIVIAATNRPEDCDPALLRRFSVRVLVDTPSRRDRKRIISRLLGNIDHSLTPRHIEEIAVATDSWSGSDLESLTREAAMTPIRECIRAAAVLKAKVRKIQQKSGVESAQEKDDLPDEDEARDSLLNNFLNLRPVSVDDFETAVAFWTGDQQYQRPQQKGRFGHCPSQQQVHYDSSSDSDDDVAS